MDSRTARQLIATHFPDFAINEIEKIGEGTGNVAFEVNKSVIFRFPKTEDNRNQLSKEIALQGLLKQYTTLPVPEFIHTPQNHSLVGYKKLQGTPLLYAQNEFNDWESFSKQLGSFLTKLHSIPSAKYKDLNVPREEKSFEEWRERGQAFFEKTRSLIPNHYHKNIESFFRSNPPERGEEVVLCHNDLGIEHVLVEKNTITGIIDWGGAALTDPAGDFARIYRDRGKELVDMMLTYYDVASSDKAGLQERAMYYGTCLFFEDLFYGMEHEEYKRKSLEALEWIVKRD